MRQLKTEDVKKYIEKFNYTLISKIYKGFHYKIKIKCSNDHIYSIRYDSFYRGDRCKKCKKIEKSNKMLKIINIFCKSIDYKCLSTFYKNSHNKLQFKCPNNHIYNCSWNNFKGNNGRRCNICLAISRCGSGNYNWRGGIQAEPYCDIWIDKEYKKSIKNRDGNKCLNPECSKTSNIICLHHIDYNKKNCHPFNLITICQSCNSKANKDREWHFFWYNAIILNRYKRRT